MEKTLKVYKIGYSNDEAFPTKDTQLLINAFTYNAKRMGDTPTISCTVKCDFIPENEWTEEVYVQFNNERFYLKRTPSSVLDNTDARYKYTLDFVSERNILNNVYFFNVVYGEKEGYKAASNDVNFRFTGDIHEFVERLNYSLQYSKLQTITNGVVEGYHVVVDDDITTEYKDVEFDSQFFSNALQEVFNTYDLPYYFVGKTIHVGHHDNDSAIEEPFEYGSEHGLISVTKTSENNKIVNRISGHGSAENIPYYYPNDTPKGVLEFVTPSTNKHLQASNFVIANGERVSSTTDLISEVDAGVSAEVEFVKHTANSIHRSYGNDGKNLLKIESYSGANNAWVETTLGYGDVQDDNKCLKNTSFTGTYGTEYTITYHVRVKFIATNQDGGVLKWEWKTNPFYKTIEKQIELDGDIAYAFFKDLKAYEIINNEQVEIKPHQSETYPTSIISTAFSGSKNSDGSSTVEIHLEFTFWKARISESQLLMYGDLLYTNFTKITLETGIKDYYRWKNARNSFVSLKDMGISLTPDSVASDFEANKDKYVGEKFSLKQTEYILPTQNLMPTIYRDSKGDERFYKALNGKYVVPDRFKEELTDDVAPDGIYPFAHPYIEGKPREHMQDFEDIKPTIKEMLNSEGKRMDIFLDFAYDKNDNDEVDENGKYLHPYFFAKLPKYDGVNGFNLFDHAIESGAMQIAMTDGWCAGCKFNIAVDPDTQKNVVQVDDKGYLVRDGYGNVVVKKGIAQDKQNDTRTNTVWIALEKDTESYGVVMPNKGTKNKPTPNKDTFVILNIALPKAYITAAEKKLEEELIHYMYNNNNQLFNFSIKFSRIYLAEHPEVLQKLNENSAITVVYKGIGYPLHVSSYTYKMDGNGILPEITVDLSDKLTIATNAIENAVQQAKAEFRTTVASIDYLSNSRNFFIRKDEDDTAIGHLDFEKGFTSNGNADFGKFVAGTQGASIYKDDAGNWYIESDYLRVRKKFSAKSVEVEEAHHVGGSQLLTAANCVVDFVKPITDSQGNTIAYRCFFLKEDSNGKGVTNKWKTGDQAYCKSFNLAGTNDGSNSDPDKYYWRKVVATSQDTSEEEMTLTSGDTTIITSNYHFIDLSNKDNEKDVQSDIPYINDNIVQLGYQGTDDASRQNAIVLAGAGEGSPYIRQYMGINSFNLPDPDTQIKPGDNVFTGKVSIKQGSTGIKDFSEWESVQAEIDNANKEAALANGALSLLSKTVDGISGSVSEINKRLDGVVENYFLEGAPTIDGYPVNEWTTDQEKINHIGDTYTNINEYYDEDGNVQDTNAGKSWRWTYCEKEDTPNVEVKDGEEVKYLRWHPIADSDAVQALLEASKAQSTADGKSATFVVKPTKYSKGDLWILDSDTDHPEGKKGDILTANADSNTYIESHWGKIVRYTDDSLASSAKEAADQAQAQASSAISASATAQTQASTAQSLASAAQQLASAAEATANMASSDAKTATEKVATLTTIANEAKETADAASELAAQTKEQADAASELANSATAAADAASKTLDEWTADNVISPLEKQGVKDEYAWVKSDREDIDNQAVKYALKEEDLYTAYTKQQNAYQTDLETIINDKRDIVPIPSKMLVHQELFYSSRTEILSRISEVAKKLAVDAQKAADEAEKAAEDAKRRAEEAEREAKAYTDGAIDGLGSGANIIRNSGFSGDYLAIDVEDGDNLSDETKLFSPSLKYWTSLHAEAYTSSRSASGYEVVILGGGHLQQEMHTTTESDANYVITLTATSISYGVISCSVGGTSVTIELDGSNTPKSSSVKFTAKSKTATLRIMTNTTCTLWDLSLIKGNIAPTTWQASPLDNRKEMASYEALSYLRKLLKAETIIDGSSVSTGVVNTGLINMGDYDEEGNRVRITAGMSGTYNNDDSVAFFGGGDLAKAITTVLTYKDNPNYEPTTEELASMAKAVITHGGRAILQDIILRGYVYAEGGVFRGKVYAEDGEFRGTIKAKDSIFEGTVYATDGEFKGTIVSSMNYSSVQYDITPSADGIRYINLSNTPCGYYVLHTNVGFDGTPMNPQVVLPNPANYVGLDLYFFLTVTSRSAYHQHLLTIETGDMFRIPSNSMVSTSCYLHSYGEYRFKSLIDASGNAYWYGMYGDFSNSHSENVDF